MTPSELTTRMESYLSLRRAMGFPMQIEEPRLRDFVAFAAAKDADQEKLLAAYCQALLAAAEFRNLD